MRLRATLMIWGAVAAAGATPARAQTGLERDVLRALNAFRTTPAAFAGDLRRYRNLFRGGMVTFPGNPVRLVTREGVAAVDEAIGLLAAQTPLAPLAEDHLLARAAADLGADQAATGRTGHFARDGASPSDRLRRHGGDGQVAEVIAYGSARAADVVRQLIVDDGVRDRGHRRLLLDPRLRYAGVSCGPHRGFGTMCVIDLGRTRQTASASADASDSMARRPAG